MRNLNILIVDDHQLYRKAIVTELSETLSATLFEAANGAEAVHMTTRVFPDVVLIDYKMPIMNGMQATKEILRKNAAVRIIVISLYDELDVIMNFLRLGARGFVSKNTDGTEIKEAIRTVLAGDYYFHSRFHHMLSVKPENGAKKNSPYFNFTHRELQIIKMITAGKTSIEIAHELEISHRTVESCKFNLINKTNVKNTAQLIDFVYRNGII
ncbi:response regulator transcription factor [Fulvivirgaceae bacterium PWU4]|uniref:Response regulator transcription factor n=1 Tax=Chryseosolibacter histidini TaxID=2782349 RepID=A0AAP2DML2_9BACT|nr:response regulator transcription factor [Chryseosolibacter histidini]MBT1699135.1 response regulator transcription factor [Chryseosolibacter histidini]